jgi:hypothetical protein
MPTTNESGIRNFLECARAHKTEPVYKMALVATEQKEQRRKYLGSFAVLGFTDLSNWQLSISAHYMIVQII